MKKLCSLVMMVTVCAFVYAGFVNPSYGKTLDEEIPLLVEKVGKQLAATDGKKKKIAIMDVLNLQGQQNELGRSLAEQLSVEVVIGGSVSVVDRANIDRIIQENKFARTLANPDDVKKLGKIAGLDAIAIGTVNCSDTFGELIVKVISIETAELIAAGKCKFDMTPDLMKQFGTAINGDATVVAGAKSTENGPPSSQESSGIAKKAFGNLEIVLKTVNQTTMPVKNGWGDSPVISCSFEFKNNDLRNSIVLASNGTEMDNQMYIALTAYRGELCDSDGVHWWIPEGMLNGLSAVLCCDVDGGKGSTQAARQNNPTAVVDYIKRGQSCSFGMLMNGIAESGKNWTGSFSTIAPGKSIRVMVNFVPVQQSNRQSKTKFPQFFQFDMELVMGSILTGEEPEKAKDLRLENLTFDKIVMPTAAKNNN